MADVDFTPLPAGVPSISQIIRTALRAAAVAPTVYDALDVTGAALARLADLAKAEVGHG
jgi:hypothetical protein